MLEPFSSHSSNTKKRALNKIDAWEADTIQTITDATERARQKVYQLVDETKDVVKGQFEKVSNEMRTGKEEENYVESTLDSWRQQLTQMKDQLETPTSTIVVNSRQVEWSSMITVTSEQVTVKVGAMESVTDRSNARATAKLSKGCSCLLDGQADNDDLLHEFELERENHLECIRDFERHIKLLKAIIEKVVLFVPRSCNYFNLDNIKLQAKFDAEKEDYILPPVSTTDLQSPQMSANNQTKNESTVRVNQHEPDTTRLKRLELLLNEGQRLRLTEPKALTDSYTTRRLNPFEIPAHLKKKYG
ncbi:unnamed protein product [Didymodactylos carnosus]|uniref:Uncharacterized protein n=1 Tax=Didymodactylos carnosus TaxID=1234261 RepID=A0A8S2EB49_9BILA|nr:unnamed protein product [Didymodactylos carnosus]CAF3859425.1 unnamed protein product [Didymodactylos carnosus]